MAKKTVKIEATDTFRGTMGVKVSCGTEIVWAGYVFPLLNPESSEVEWAVDTYVGTQELDYFLKNLEVREGFKGMEKNLRSEVTKFLGVPTFDMGEKQASLETKTLVL